MVLKLIGMVAICIKKVPQKFQGNPSSCFLNINIFVKTVQ